MVPNIKQSEKMEFIGAQPKNSSIIYRIRDHGYVGVMFNNDDFLDAVVWAANIVYEYDNFFDSRKSERVLIPLDELPFLKLDVENAHMIMLVYYKMKQNFVLAEKVKQSLYTLARFQKIADEDKEIMKKIGERIADAEKRHEEEFNFYDIPELTGSEKKYNSYASRVTDQIEKYREECAKAKV